MLATASSTDWVHFKWHDAVRWECLVAVVGTYVEWVCEDFTLHAINFCSLLDHICSNQVVRQLKTARAFLTLKEDAVNGA